MCLHQTRRIKGYIKGYILCKLKMFTFALLRFRRKRQYKSLNYVLYSSFIKKLT